MCIQFEGDEKILDFLEKPFVQFRTITKKADWEINQWLPNTSKKLLRRIDLMEDNEILRAVHAGQPVITLAPGKQYSAALRFLFFWRDEWDLKSDWYEWRLER